MKGPRTMVWLLLLGLTAPAYCPVARTQTLAYRVTLKGDYKGSDLSGDYWAASLWRLEGGRWWLVQHTEARAQ